VGRLAVGTGQSRERLVELSAQHLGAESHVAAPEPATSAADPVVATLTLSDAVERFRRELIEARLRPLAAHPAAQR